MDCMHLFVEHPEKVCRYMHIYICIPAYIYLHIQCTTKLYWLRLSFNVLPFHIFTLKDLSDNNPMANVSSWI